MPRAVVGGPIEPEKYPSGIKDRSFLRLKLSWTDGNGVNRIEKLGF